ncbi:PIN domain-containing protein [Mycobacterium intracellulare]|uniref:PIN domain-containing protein n=1 Tax=Mycobacterium intracellulare TaxID=1767 RepID=UPI0035563AB4
MPEQPKQVLIVDTNILWSGQPFRDSVPWTNLLFSAAKYSAADFVVPEVVVHELARQEVERIKRSRSEGAKALAKARAEFARAGISFPDTPTVRDVRASVLESRQDISERMRSALADQGILVAPIPTIAHATLVSWSLDGHPPFDSTDKGYRDALIWRTVRDVAAAQPDGAMIVFVCEDGDFTQKGAAGDGVSDRVLRQELAVDLGHVTSNTVTVVRSMHEAIDILAEPDQVGGDAGRVHAPGETTEFGKPGEALDGGESDENIQDDFDEYPSRDELLRDHIESACDLLIGEEIGSSYDGPGRRFEYQIPDVENATVTAVMPDLSSMSTDVHERFEGDTVIGTVSVEAEILYDGYVTKADAVYADDRTWSVADGNWNDHYALVEGALQGELMYEFVLNNEDVSLEFDAVVHLSE